MPVEIKTEHRESMCLAQEILCFLAGARVGTAYSLGEIQAQLGDTAGPGLRPRATVSVAHIEADLAIDAWVLPVCNELRLRYRSALDNLQVLGQVSSYVIEGERRWCAKLSLGAPAPASRAPV